MATVTGLTAARMLEIEDASVVAGVVNGSGHLILTTHGGDDIDAGYVLGDAVPATTTVAGIAELATRSETLAMSDSTRTVTPDGLVDLMATKAAASHTHIWTDITSGVPAASTSASGIVELATSAETSALSDTVRAVTPGGLATLMGTKAASSHTHGLGTADITGTLPNSKLDTMAANTIKGNNTGSTAAPVDMTVTQLRTLIDPGWTSYTPVLKVDGSGTPNVGSGGSITGQYRLFDGMIDLDVQVTWGTSITKGTGDYYIELPVSKTFQNVKFALGIGGVLGATAELPAVVIAASTNRMFLSTDTAGSVGSTWTIANGDSFRWQLRGVRIN